MDIEKLKLVIAKHFPLDKEEKLEKMTADFIEKYYFYVLKYVELENDLSIDNAEQLFRREKFSKTSVLYLEWFEQNGEGLFEHILSHLDLEKLNSKLKSFYEYYLFMCEEALEQRNADLLLDHLYRIPQIMKEEYEIFGFLIQRNSMIGSYLEKLENDFVFVTIKRPEVQVSCLI